MTSPPQKTLKHGRYVLVRVLGEGSQGETYEARDTAAEKTTERPDPRALLEQWNRYVTHARGETPRHATVAIKCFRVAKAKEWKDVELAEREATTLRSLDHPRLPRYIEHFEEDGVLYLVMEKIDGESLASLRRRPRFGEIDVIRMLEDIADALRYLHGRAPAIVHRDVKPGNIIRRPDRSYALVDFGSVRDRLNAHASTRVSSRRTTRSKTPRRRRDAADRDGFAALRHTGLVPLPPLSTRLTTRCRSDPDVPRLRSSVIAGRISSISRAA